jgi:hypothetical protein
MHAYEMYTYKIDTSDMVYANGMHAYEIHARKDGLVRVAEALAAGVRDYCDGLTFANSIPRADFSGE